VHNLKELEEEQLEELEFDILLILEKSFQQPVPVEEELEVLLLELMMRAEVNVMALR